MPDALDRLPLQRGFSALQRAEIAEMLVGFTRRANNTGFSALQRAEIAEILPTARFRAGFVGFSALQRAEIAEIDEKIQTGDIEFQFQCSSTSRNC